MKSEQTFQRLYRIRRSSDYDRTWREGQRYHSSHFVVIVTSGRECSRLGITVSRKVGNAVRRNQLKRWIRELFRRHRKQLRPFLDISIIAKRQAGHLNHLQLDRELLTIFARLETDDHV